MRSRKRPLRLIVQLAFFSAAGVLLWPLLPWKAGPKVVAQASPFAAICSSLTLKSISAGMLLGWALAIVAFLKRRFFCRYVCPTGVLLEGASQIGIKKTTWWSRCPPLGKYIALLTFIGAAVGYPILLWMDPLSILSSAYSIRTAGSVTFGILAGLFLGILIMLNLVFGSVWCARLCPLGGTQDLLVSARSWFTDRRKSQAAQAGRDSGSITERTFLARRAILLGVAGVGLGLWARKIGASRGENAPLRPPGASEEHQFAGLCERCGNCIRVCPSRIIHPDTGLAGLAGLLAPAIQYEKEYCLEDCAACTQVCPSGALQAMDVDQKRRYIIGEALVDGSICLLVLGEKDCDACMRSCPFDAVRVHWDESRYIAYPLVDPNKCNGCGACEVACPTQGIKAIRVWRRTDLRMTIDDGKPRSRLS
jgi:ferredoxin-type protein NapF